VGAVALALGTVLVGALLAAPLLATTSVRQLVGVGVTFDFVLTFASGVLCALCAPISAPTALILSAFLLARFHQCLYQFSSAFISGHF
jgi:hypothetical protein